MNMDNLIVKHNELTAEEFGFSSNDGSESFKAIRYRRGME